MQLTDCPFCAFQAKRAPRAGYQLVLCTRHASAWRTLNDVALQETLPIRPRTQRASAAQRLRSISRNGAQ